MNILAIETSCDETAIAVVEFNGERITVRSNIVSSQIDIHAQWGGVVPALAAREHAKNIEHVLNTALKEAGIDDPERQLDLLAVTHGPGLGPALIVGINFARTLAEKWSKPLIGVDHMDGHIHSNWLRPEPPRNVFPALNLIVSGGHTDLVLMHDHGDYEILGETQDDAVGEAFDKVARLLGLGYPGGPKISKLAPRGDASRYPLPRPMLKSGDLNFSYSGLKTAVLYLIRDLTGSSSAGSELLSEQQKTDIAASFQEAAIDVLVQKTRKAAQQHAVQSIMLSGGVSANPVLREQLDVLAQELGVLFYCPDMQYTGDNASMIAVAAYFVQKNGVDTDWQHTHMDANLRLGQN